MLLAGHPVSLVAAYAIEGALTGTHWNQIPPAKKLEVQRLFAVMKREISQAVPAKKAARKGDSASAAKPAAGKTAAKPAARSGDKSRSRS